MTACFLADNTVILRVILKNFRLLLTISPRQNNNRRSAIFALLPGLENGHFARYIVSLLLGQTNTSCSVALFNSDIDSTQVPKLSSLNFVSQSSVEPSLVFPSSSAMPPFSSHAFPDFGSLEAVVNAIHVSPLTPWCFGMLLVPVPPHRFFQFVAFAGHASFPPFVVRREHSDIS